MSRATPDTLLLCIDMQPAFMAAIPGAARVQLRCAFALESAHGLGLPVLFTEQVPAKLGRTTPELLALAPKPESMGKDAFSAFGDERIKRRLQEIGAEHLIICGIEAPVCVYQTAIDALRNDYQVTILTDCVGARRADDATTALAALAKAGCHLLPSETVFYALLNDARHPFFRAFTSLVKKYG
ncbi:MAG: isochorismatase family protein [Opitutae bacterium]|nr:isochorismatase family protein [Opitutae bacterium]